MVPRDLSGKFWPTDKATMVLRRIQQDVASKARENDRLAAKSAGREMPESGCVYKMYRQDEKNVWEETSDASQAERMAVDPVLASLQHDGESSTREMRKLWARFCSQPRDHSGIAADAPYTEEDPLGEHRRSFLPIAESVPWGEQAENPRPGQSRPSKQAVAS